jgi:D-alanyl-D-alanine dipeptidase
VIRAPRALLTLAALAACHDRSPSPPSPPSPATSPSATKVLVTGIAADWTSTQITLRVWQKRGTQPWQPLGDPWRAVIGRNGLALAADKREGDGKAPAGQFTLRAAYGYDATAPSGTKLPYHASDHLECVDDPASPHYNQIVDATITKHDWTSSEEMRRPDALYTYVIEIAHNALRTPQAGSCIFFHVWGGPDTTTSGCTAMPEDKLVELLRVVDRDASYILLPRTEYARVAADHDLPPLR